jgi:hypothetical protein
MWPGLDRSTAAQLPPMFNGPSPQNQTYHKPRVMLGIFATLWPSPHYHETGQLRTGWCNFLFGSFNLESKIHLGGGGVQYFFVLYVCFAVLGREPG